MEEALLDAPLDGPDVDGEDVRQFLFRVELVPEAVAQNPDLAPERPQLRLEAGRNLLPDLGHEDLDQGPLLWGKGTMLRATHRCSALTSRRRQGGVLVEVERDTVAIENDLRHGDHRSGLDIIGFMLPRGGSAEIPWAELEALRIEVAVEIRVDGYLRPVRLTDPHATPKLLLRHLIPDLVEDAAHAETLAPAAAVSISPG